MHSYAAYNTENYNQPDLGAAAMRQKLGSRIWGQTRFPPPEKNELVLSIEMGCTDTVHFPRESNIPF